MTATQSSTGAEERDRVLAYLLVRLVVGTSLFGHGLVRLPKLSAFHGQLMREFKTSILPEILVSPIGYALPFVELAIGVLLLAGALTRAAAITGGLVMIVMVFGSTSIEHFGVIGEQLIHASLLAALLMFRRHNTYSIDHIIARNRR
ncbi:DoxX family protein [Mycobacterium sp.]|uniref:DoxX family protein n=1 Tax=Mycobacterium sp. TaxID=1785 RepID=UPI003F9B3261